MREAPQKPNPARALRAFWRLQTMIAPWLMAFRIREIASSLLSVFPLRFKIAGVNVVIRCWSDITAFLEIFYAGIYDPVFSRDRVRTYCDLGCQSGFALLRLAGIQGMPAKSLLVDGNPEAIKRCNKNFSQPHYHQTHLLHGVVGWKEKDAKGSASFTLRANELECSLTNGSHVHRGAKVISVPVVGLEKEWIRHMGPRPCDLIKIDIEGAEKVLLQKDSAFFARVKRCVLEWHGGTSNRQEIVALLKKLGFGEFEILWDSPQAGILACRNQATFRDIQT